MCDEVGCACVLLFIVYCLLFIVYCLLFIVYCLLFIVIVMYGMVWYMPEPMWYHSPKPEAPKPEAEDRSRALPLTINSTSQQVFFFGKKKNPSKVNISNNSQL